MSQRAFWFSVLVVGLLVTSHSAEAATRTVCFQLRIRDNVRFNCPTAGTAGAVRPCRPASGYIDAVGWEVSLWDKDSGDGTGDEYIGLWHTPNGGTSCITFEWENASYSLGEADPDLYITINNRVTSAGTNGTRVVDIVTGAGADYVDITWRNGVAGEPDRYVAQNCQAGSSCRILPGAALSPTTDATTNYGQALLAAESAGRTLDRYAGIMDSGVIDIEFPTTRVGCGTACTIGRALIAFPAGLATDGVRVAHEMGHALHEQMFEQDFLTSDCSWGNPGWALDTFEWQSCAVSEGWATYVGAVSWYNPGNANSVPFAFGFDLETSALIDGTCANNGWIAGQVAKTFWDLDDANNEGGTGTTAGSDDVTNLGTVAIASGWDGFADGTNNRQDRESDANGVNLRDYDFNFNVNDETLLDHNCMGSQAND